MFVKVDFSFSIFSLFVYSSLFRKPFIFINSLSLSPSFLSILSETFGFDIEVDEWCESVHNKNCE